MLHRRHTHAHTHTHTHTHTHAHTHTHTHTHTHKHTHTLSLPLSLRQLTVAALVHSLRAGGRFIEDTSFAADLYTPPAPLPPVTSDVSSIATVVGDEGAEVDVDLRVHVGRGRMSMGQAMGPSMVLLKSSVVGTTNFWRKN